MQNNTIPESWKGRPMPPGWNNNTQSSSQADSSPTPQLEPVTKPQPTPQPAPVKEENSASRPMPPTAIPTAEPLPEPELQQDTQSEFPQDEISLSQSSEENIDNLTPPPFQNFESQVIDNQEPETIQQIEFDEPIEEETKNTSRMRYFIIFTIVIFIGLICYGIFKIYYPTNNDSYDTLVDSDSVAAVEEFYESMHMQEAQLEYVYNKLLTDYDGSKYRYTGYIDEYGKPEGSGTASYDNWKYSGNFKAGQFHGEGTLEVIDDYGNKTSITGDWKAGNIHYGTMKVSSGEKFIGTFIDAAPWNGNIYDEYGNWTGKIEYGELQ